MIFSQICCHGSILDSEITQKCGAMYLVKKEHEVLNPDVIQSRGIVKLTKKIMTDSLKKDTSCNFDIAATQIQAEWFNGSVHDLTI